MEVGTNQVKNALWEQLESLKKTDFKNMNSMDREMQIKKNEQMLKITAQVTDVLKIELQAFQTYAGMRDVKVSSAAAKHFGIIDNV